MIKSDIHGVSWPLCWVSFHLVVRIPKCGTMVFKLDKSVSVITYISSDTSENVVMMFTCR